MDATEQVTKGSSVRNAITMLKRRTFTQQLKEWKIKSCKTRKFTNYNKFNSLFTGHF